MKVFNVKPRKLFPDGLATIYTKQEALERGMVFLPHDRWRDAQEGEYAETCDGYITPIIKRNDNDPQSCHIKTPTGCFHTSPDRYPSFDTKEFFNRNFFTRGITWSGNGKLTPMQEEVVDLFCDNGFDLEQALLLVYGNVKYSWKGDAAKVASSKKFKKAVMGRVEDVIKLKGIDISLEKILMKLEEALDGTSGESKNFKSIIQMAARVIGEDIFEDKKYLTPKTKRNLFSEAEEAEYEDSKEKMTLLKGPIRESNTG